METTIKDWLEKAENGDANAMSWVGNCYHKGQGVEQDDVEAVRWYTRAAEAGSLPAMLILGKCYMSGIGVAVDRTVGLQWVRQAADGGYEKAQTWLAENLPRLVAAKLERAKALFTGKGVKKDVATAIALYREAAEDDVVEAQEILALCYRFGDGVKKNADLAAYWYLRAQRSGRADAMNALAEMEQRGGLSATYLKMRRAALQEDGLAAYELWQAYEPNPDTARMALYFCALGAQAGYAPAQMAYAEYFEKGILVKADAAQSRVWLEKAAQGGDPEARYRYGSYLLTQKRDKEAVRLLCAAADGGHLDAQLKMGRCLEYGIGTARDASEAARIYRQAAPRSSRACYLLGKLYLTGRLRDEEPRTALDWYRKGYEMDGNVLCAFGIGQCTRDGIGVKQDVDRANGLLAEAVPALEKLAEQRDPIGMTCLAELHFYGLGGKVLNPRKAVELYTVAAEQGEPVAQLGLGDCYARSNMLKDPSKAAIWYARAAESGIPAAQYCYGLCLRNGTGVEKDIPTSKELFLEAAKGGHSEAQYALGEYYAKGLYETKLDPVQAVEWYGEAARSGHAGARYALGQCCERGIGMDKNMETAVEWYHSAAEAGSAAANCRLGELYDAGDGVEQDDAKAVAHFRLAAAAGHAGACYQLGLCYEGGRGVKKDQLLAYRWYEQAGDLPDAVYARGVCLAAGIGTKANPPAAFDCFVRAADAGNADAMFRAGYCLLTGNGITASAKKALSYLQRGAEAGQAEAAYTLGICYADGRVIEQSPAQAAAWFSRAAEAEHSDAQCRLGVCYERGIGVEKDWVKAATYYRFAAEADNAIACYRLARCHEHGIGVPTDAHAALRWYERSAELGNTTALTVLGLRGDAAKSEARLQSAAKQGNPDAAWELAVRAERAGGDEAKEKTVRYLQLAAKAGHVKATYYLGLALDTGAGVITDHKGAVERYKKAAEIGYPPAQYRYGLCLALGRGTQADTTAAKLWLSRAKQNGVAQAEEALALLK